MKTINKELQAQLDRINAKEKVVKLICVDCGSNRAKPRSFSFGSAGMYNAIQCDGCWKETLYEDLLD